MLSIKWLKMVELYFLCWTAASIVYPDVLFGFCLRLQQSTVISSVLNMHIHFFINNINTLTNKNNLICLFKLNRKKNFFPFYPPKPSTRAPSCPSSPKLLTLLCWGRPGCCAPGWPMWVLMVLLISSGPEDSVPSTVGDCTDRWVGMEPLKKEAWFPPLKAGLSCCCCWLCWGIPGCWVWLTRYGSLGTGYCWGKVLPPAGWGGKAALGGARW